MFQRTLLCDGDVQPLADGVCCVLESVGVLCQNEDLLRALADAGARVDHASERARFPKQMVTAFVDALRAEASRRALFQSADDGSVAAAGEEKPEGAGSPFPRFVPPETPSLGTQIAQFFYDYGRAERRPGNRADLIALIQLADVLHPEVPAGHALVQRAVPPLLEPLETALLLAEYAHRPGMAFAWYVEQVDYLREMGEILGIPDWFTWGAICFAHPLRFDKAVADKFVRRVREGVPTGLTAMPIAGLTTPVTPEGFIVVSSAEHVATWLAARALNPEVPLSGSMWAGSVDMRSGAVSYSSFDAMYYGCAAVEFLRCWTGIEVPIGGGEYCDAREPGLYAALEKAYKAMTIAAFTGRHPGIGEGMLEEGKTIAPVQLLIERDLNGGLAQFGRTIQPTTERMALPSIEEVDLGFTANHMLSEHTLHHFRQNMWLPQLIDRAGWAGAAGDRALLDKAQARMQELLASYHKPEGREKSLARMRQVVERAKRALG